MAKARSSVRVLERDRERLARTSTAIRIADILRARVADGTFLPGTRLSEEAISAALGVSRNTLRESFRLLSHEGLVVHEMNRGVFIRELRPADVADLYRVRRVLECGAIRYAGVPSPKALAVMDDAVRAGRKAAERSRWRDVGTASIRFHVGIVELSRSDRLVEVARQVMAEFRLVHPLLHQPRLFYAPGLARHEQMLDHLNDGDLGRAEQALDTYLQDSERQLLALFD